MVLSLAFILAFIGSAVALLIGILIFSEITEAMALTLPTLADDVNVDFEQNDRDGSTVIAIDTAHLPSTYTGLNPTETITGIKIPILGIDEEDGVWFGREHCPIALCSTDGNENRVRFEVVQGAGTATPALVGQSAQMNVIHSAQIKTDAYIGKVFDPIELDGKTITIEISQGANFNTGMQARIYDGELDPNLTGACGTDCFPLDSPIVTSGSGGFVTLFIQPNTATGVVFKVAIPNLSTFDSPTGKATLVIVMEEHQALFQIRDNLYSVEIQDKGKFLFRNDPADPLWNGTMIIQVIRGNSPSIDDGYVLFASKPPIVCDFEFGVYDSSLNLLDSGAGMVLIDTPQTLEVIFASPIPIPADGIISIGVLGEAIFFEGSTELTDKQTGVQVLPDPFVSDGTVASSQTTILVVFSEGFNSESVLSAHDTFNNALNVGFTVIGILPVALFFALFAIFSGRTE